MKPCVGEGRDSLCLGCMALCDRELNILEGGKGIRHAHQDAWEPSLQPACRGQGSTYPAEARQLSRVLPLGLHPYPSRITFVPGDVSNHEAFYLVPFTRSLRMHPSFLWWPLGGRPPTYVQADKASGHVGMNPECDTAFEGSGRQRFFNPFLFLPSCHLPYWASKPTELPRMWLTRTFLTLYTHPAPLLGLRGTQKHLLWWIEVVISGGYYSFHPTLSLLTQF